MSVLILDVFGSEIDVPYVSFVEGTPIFLGGVSDSFNLTERNSIRAMKRNWTVTTGYLDAATEASVRTVIGNMAQIYCQGDGFNNGLANIVCSLIMTSRTAVVGLPGFWQLMMAVKAVTAA